MFEWLLSRLGGVKKSADPYIAGPDLPTLGGVQSASGVQVGQITAMQVSAVYAAVRIRARDVARCTPTLVITDAAGGKNFVTDHELVNLFANPNPLQTWFAFAEQMMAAYLLRENAYAVKLRDGRGRVYALIPINPDWVTLREAPDGQLFYYVTRQGLWMMASLSSTPMFIPAEDMLHLRGMSFNTLMGISRIFLARDAIGLALGQEQQSARWMGNGARPSGVLQTDKTLSKDVAERLKDNWNRVQTGIHNAGKTAVLEDGLKWAPMQLTSVDLEFLSSREFSIREIGRFFELPPHKLGEMADVPKATVAELNADYVQNVVMSDLTRLEQLFAKEWNVTAPTKVRFDELQLLRADPKTVTDTARAGVLSGIMSQNEARAMIGLGPKTGKEEGPDALLQPTNLAPNGSAIDNTAPDNAGRPPGGEDPKA